MKNAVQCLRYQEGTVPKAEKKFSNARLKVYFHALIEKKKKKSKCQRFRSVRSL